MTDEPERDETKPERPSRARRVLLEKASVKSIGGTVFSGSWRGMLGDDEPKP